MHDYRWFWGSHMTLFVVYYTCLILHPMPGDPSEAHKGKVWVSGRGRVVREHSAQGTGAARRLLALTDGPGAGGAPPKACPAALATHADPTPNAHRSNAPSPQLYVILPLVIYLANVVWNRWRRRGALARIVKAEVRAAAGGCLGGACRVGAVQAAIRWTVQLGSPHSRLQPSRG